MLPPGEIIPGTRYRIVTRVGTGAMGAVYQAEHVDLEKRVALKTLHAASARDPEAIERFRQEARAASKIGNPNICDVTDFGELPDGQVFFVMEYIDGPSLRGELDEHKQLGIERSIAILRQVCKALGAAHGKGIVHLDVKPDNIMLAAKGRRRDLVKVVDFGIAGLVSAEPPPEGRAAEEKLVGTPDYLAPERIRGKGYDHRSDIYSLGAMAYEMLTGVCPFWDKDVMTTVARHITEKPQSLRQRAPEAKIPGELETLVLQMLEKNPAGARADRVGRPGTARRRRRLAEETGRQDAVSALAPPAPFGPGVCPGGHSGIGRGLLLWSAAAQRDRRVHAGLRGDHQDRRG
jgi:serine/threonine protein kinase